MKIEFYERIPGNHRLLIVVDMDAVPREDETVFFNDDDGGRTVHSVSYFAHKNRARVLLA